MPVATIALLADRSVVSVKGEDAHKLLSGIITNDMDQLVTQPAIFAGLLTPQGKILFDFFVVNVDGGFLLDVAQDQAAALVRRLAMYRLRAKVDITVVDAEFLVAAAWNIEDRKLPDAYSFPDPRHPGMGWRFIARGGAVYPSGLAGLARAVEADAGAYHAYRIALGVPEGGKDYDFGDAFPHEANFDLLNGVSFEKGCYVGQEIVARMQHRATVRKRVVRVAGTVGLPALRPEVKMGEVVIGRLGSIDGKGGLALIRLDRAIEAIDQGIAISVDGLPVEVDAVMIERQRELMAAKAVSQ